MHRNLLIRILLILGLLLTLAGAVDPMEGSVVIVVGLMVLAVGAFLEHGRDRGMVYVSLALGAVGTAALFILSYYGGVGGSTGRSWWWALGTVPYPVGRRLGLVFGLRTLIRAFHHPRAPRRAI